MSQLLIPRYPGGKRKLLSQIYDGGRYDSIVEPFIGGGAATLRLLPIVGNAYLSDADPTVWSIWHCWNHPELHLAVYENLKTLKNEAIADIASAWISLKAEFEAANTSNPARLAAVSLTIRKLTFGGVVREGANGHLNVKWVQCQVDTLPRWRYRFPPFPPNAHISLSQSWEAALDAFEKSSSEAAIALIDPPYWVPYTPGTKRKGRGGMTPAYIGHKPHDEATLAMCVNCVQRLAVNPCVKRVVVANYLSARLDAALFDIAAAANLPIVRTVLGRLDGLNMSRAVSTENLDTLWTIGQSHQSQLALNLEAV